MENCKNCKNTCKVDDSFWCLSYATKVIFFAETQIKEISFKYREIEEKALRIAKSQSDLDWWNAKTDITIDGILFSLKDNGITTTILITWEQLNENN